MAETVPRLIAFLPQAQVLSGAANVVFRRIELLLSGQMVGFAFAHQAMAVSNARLNSLGVNMGRYLFDLYSG